MQFCVFRGYSYLFTLRLQELVISCLGRTSLQKFYLFPGVVPELCNRGFRFAIGYCPTLEPNYPAA